jgi:hypothetical protein
MIRGLQILGAFFSLVGSVFVGIVAQGGIAKKGHVVKAPKMPEFLIGWILMIFGFLFSFIVALM